MFKILENQKIMYMPLWFAPNCRNYKCRFMKTLKDICIKILSFIIYNHPSINSITSWPHQNTVICGKNIILDNYFSWKKKITMEVKLFLKIRNDKVESTLFLKKKNVSIYSIQVWILTWSMTHYSVCGFW